MVYDKGRFNLVESAELEAFGGARMNDYHFRHRSPLMAKFHDRLLGHEFIVILNHLARGNAELRQEQAKALRLWADAQRLPLFAIGDYNFDFDFPSNRGNEAFEEFTKNGTWTWLRPRTLVDTNWADRDGDGKDDCPDSCLDFMFASGLPDDWFATSRVVYRSGDFPDDDSTSYHLPVELTILPAATVEPRVAPKEFKKLDLPSDALLARNLAAKVKNWSSVSDVEMTIGTKPASRDNVRSWGDLHVETTDYSDNGCAVFLNPELAKGPVVTSRSMGFHPAHERSLALRFNLRFDATGNRLVQDNHWSLGAPRSLSHWVRDIDDAWRLVSSWRTRHPHTWTTPGERDDLDTIVYGERLKRYFRITGRRFLNHIPATRWGYGERYGINVVPSDEEKYLREKQ